MLEVEKKRCIDSSDCQGRPAPYHTALFISFLVEPELSFTCWRTCEKKKWLSPSSVQKYTFFLSQKLERKYHFLFFFIQDLDSLIFSLGDKGRLSQTMKKKKYIFAHNLGFAAVNPAGWSWLSPSSLWPLINFAITHSRRLIKEYEVASKAFAVNMQAPLVPWRYLSAEPTHMDRFK